MTQPPPPPPPFSFSTTTNEQISRIGKRNSIEKLKFISYV
jgi:hypothetical protein